MEEEQEKITLPLDLQVKMMDFFLQTSIPRKIRQDMQKVENPSSEISEKGK